MFTFAQHGSVSRKLIGLAVATAIAAGSAGSLAAADDAHAARCDIHAGHCVQWPYSP
jgi:hypothetical protein